MPTLSELIASRRAAIEQFKSDMYGHDDHDISVLNEAIEKAPIVSKEDALAIVDLNSSKASERFSASVAKKPQQPIVVSLLYRPK